MLKRTLLTALAAAAMLAFAARAQAAYLTLGTTNTSNATTTLTGNTAGSELLVKNSNGSSASAFGLYGLLTPTSPTVSATAVRGQNSSTNGKGFGVYGSQAGSGTGVRGFAPSGNGVWGSSTSGTGVLGQHTATAGTAPGVFGTHAGTGPGVYGTSVGGNGVRGDSTNLNGIAGLSENGTGVFGKHSSTSGTAPGVIGTTNSTSDGAFGVYGQISSTSPGTDSAGVRGENNGTSLHAIGVLGSSAGSGPGVEGRSDSGDGVYGLSYNSSALYGFSNTDIGVYGLTGNSSYNYAGYFYGNVNVNGTCTGCAGPSALQIDDPLDPAHKYLQHSSVASSQQLNMYSGNVTTNAKGFATVTMPHWFQALNQSFRYQLTSLSGLQQVAVAKEMHDNRFTVQSQRPHAKVSWQVTAVRHDRYAKAHPIRVVASKAKAEQGKYLHPELYGQPRSEGIGYRKPPRPPHRSAVQR